MPPRPAAPSTAPASELSRRDWLGRASVLAAAALGAGALPAMAAAPRARMLPTTPDEAMRALLEGNARFAAGNATAPHRNLARVREVAAHQEPFAAILGCADSRVPVELVFDQGFGDLFPVRVAGNVVSSEIVGSLEYAAEVLGASVVLVLGHSACGAVKAAMSGGAVPGQISALYQRIAPAVDEAKGDLAAAVEHNVRNQARLLAHSPVLAARVKRGTLLIAGAVYDLASGRVRRVAVG